MSTFLFGSLSGVGLTTLFVAPPWLLTVLVGVAAGTFAALCIIFAILLVTMPAAPKPTPKRNPARRQALYKRPLPTSVHGFQYAGAA